MKQFRWSVSPATVLATVALVVALGGGAVVAQAGPFSGLVFKPLTLQNGWKVTQFGTAPPAVANDAGIVHFKGAMSSPVGTNTHPFTMPVGFRPAHTVFIPVDMCSATNGRVVIERTGVVTVQAEKDFQNAKCFTSLDGASFAQ